MFFTINKRMLVYKLFYLFSIAAMSITLFLSLYFKQLGMSPLRIGVISSARPILLAFSAPVIGVLTDKYQCPKATVMFGGILWIGSTIVMGFLIPSLEEKSCVLIQKELKQLISSNCNSSCEHRFETCFFINNENATNSSSNSQLSKESKGINQVNNMQTRDKLQCDSLKRRLEADRSWLYTPESLEAVFYFLLISDSLLEMTFNPLHSIADAEAVNTLEDMGIDIADYGKQRAFGSVGWGIAPMIFGPWIAFSRKRVTKCGVTLSKVDYEPMFYVFIFMSVGAMCTTGFFSYKYKQQSHGKFGVDKDVLIQLCKLPNSAVLFVVMFIGICNGALQGYFYWHLDSIGANELTMGLSSVCHSISEFMLGLSTGAAIRQFGHLPLISVGMLTYLVRFVIYAYVKHPWWAITSEILHSLTFLLTWNTSISYLSLIVPEDFRTSLASLLNALYNGVGNAIGYLLSGFLINLYGSAIAFQMYAVVCACTAVILIILFLKTSSSIKDTGNNDEEIKAVLLPKEPPNPVPYERAYPQLDYNTKTVKN